jgi:hypothetical protein
VSQYDGVEDWGVKGMKVYQPSFIIIFSPIKSSFKREEDALCSLFQVFGYKIKLFRNPKAEV